MGGSVPNGGPAFPTSPNTQPGFYEHHGMSLRDWFAGQALQGLIASPDDPHIAKSFGEVASHYARTAYAYADAMISAREASR